MWPRPGNDLVQLKLFRDYAANAPLYLRLHDYFRASGVPLLAVWGRGDEIFGPVGAEAFADDYPGRNPPAGRRAFLSGIGTGRSRRTDLRLSRPGSRGRLTNGRTRSFSTHHFSGLDIP